ncbi:tail fiber assembly protein [Morganella psychrotolerans]|uniref:tail fiber assembly protein n=1 Tax=Morganella psychrotolerans TaxID=368603 RepID=UPI0039AEF860
MKTENKPEYFFSPSTVSFYPEAMLDDYRDAGTLPDDLVNVENNVFAEFSGTPPDGKVRGVLKGKPAWVNMPPPTPEQMIAAAEIQKQRLLSRATTVIAPLQDAVDLDMATPEEEALLKEWKKYRVMLNRVDTSPGADVIWPMPPA